MAEHVSSLGTAKEKGNVISASKCRQTKEGPRGGRAGAHGEGKLIKSMHASTPESQHFSKSKLKL